MKRTGRGGGEHWNGQKISDDFAFFPPADSHFRRNNVFYICLLFFSKKNLCNCSHCTVENNFYMKFFWGEWRMSEACTFYSKNS